MKTHHWGFQPGPTNSAVELTEDGLRLEILHLGSRGIALCNENEGADDQLHDYVQLICAFVLAYTRSRFSYDTAQI